MVDNVNYLDLMEGLILNKYTKKLLPQAALMKRFIEKTPKTRERFYAISKDRPRENFGQQENSTNDPPDEKIDENQPHKEFNDQEQKMKEEVEVVSRAPESEASSKKIQENEEEIKQLFRLFIENQISFRAGQDPLRGKTEAKKHQKSFQEINSPDKIIEDSSAKNKKLGNDSILNQKTSKVLKNQSSQEIGRPSDALQNDSETPKSPQKSSNPGSKPPSPSKRPNRVPPGPRSRKRIIGRKSSLGSRKMLFKSKFSASGFRKKSSTKLK